MFPKIAMKFLLFTSVPLIFTIASANAKIGRFENEESVFSILPGIELVGKSSLTNAENRHFQRETGTETLLDHAINYLGTHDIKLKLNNFMNSSDVSNVYKQVVQSFANQNEYLEEARKKDKGGLGYVLMMGLMMGKTMAALGFGGVAALAAKALGASLAALLLSAVVALKKLSDSGHSDSGGHHVQYYTADHH